MNTRQIHRQGEKFSTLPTADVKLGTSGYWTGAGVTATLVSSFFRHSPWLHGHWWQHTSVLSLSPWMHGLQPRKLYTSVAVTPAPVHVPWSTQRPLVLSLDESWKIENLYCELILIYICIFIFLNIIQRVST